MNQPGAQHILQRGISFILDPAFNNFVRRDVNKFLFVESNFDPPPPPFRPLHTNGVDGIILSGYTIGVDFEHHDATTLDSELNLLGSKYAGIVVASDWGGVLTAAELNILNTRSTDILAFLNAGGGLFALANSNDGLMLTTGAIPYG